MGGRWASASISCEAAAAKSGRSSLSPAPRWLSRSRRDHPFGPHAQGHRASSRLDDDTAAQWFAGRRHPQIGIVTGACSDGVFVIDLDTHKSPDAAQWWQQVLTDHDALAFETPTQTTGGGGTQILFRAPSGWIPPTNKTSIGVDIRGQGGFAMLPPSRHESGRDYAWKEGLEPWAVPVMEAPPACMCGPACACEGAVKSTCSEIEHQENRRTEFIILKSE